MKNALGIGCLIGLFRLLTVTPIWYYLLYQILTRVESSELMMFLFWIYVPLSLILGIFGVAIDTLIKNSQDA